jgi:transcriptional regulator with XRE-family HTH domain
MTRRPHPVSRAVADEVRRLRRARGWSKATLAEVAGLPFPSIVNIERPDTAARAAQIISVDDLVDLAAALDVTPTELLGSYGLRRWPKDNGGR